MKGPLLAQLRCPFCAGNLSLTTTDWVADEVEYAVLACHCDRYPVVAGIPILKKGAVASGGESIDKVVALIEAGQHREALLATVLPRPCADPALAPAWIQVLPSVRGFGRLQALVAQRVFNKRRQQAGTLLTAPGNQVTACDLFDLYFHSLSRGDEFYNYFVFRFGQPRHLVALSFASIIHHPQKQILDLGCGFGHITRYLHERAQDQPVIGVDHDFFSLFVAKGWIAPKAEYVCSSAEASLPFPDGSFSAVFCSDTFWVIHHKATCIGELKRLTQDAGLILLVGLRNRLVMKAPYTDRWSLPPEGYQTLVADMPHRLVASSTVLARYIHKQGPPLARPTQIEHLANEQWLSVVASYREELLQDYGYFEDWPHAQGHLTLNPLYREEGRDEFGKVHLHLTIPSAKYELENGECRQYEPERLAVDSKVLTDIAHGLRTAEVERLIQQCVVVGMPERFLNTQRLPHNGRAPLSS